MQSCFSNYIPGAQVHSSPAYLPDPLSDHFKGQVPRLDVRICFDLTSALLINPACMASHISPLKKQGSEQRMDDINQGHVVQSTSPQ